MSRSLSRVPTRRKCHRWLFVSLLAFACPNLSHAIDYNNLSTDDYLGDVQVLATVEDDKVFTEGPAADEGGVLFTNVPASKILRYDEATKKLSVWREDTEQANGLIFDPQGRLLMCQGDAGKLSRLDIKSKKLEVLASEYNGFPLAAPNDLCFDSKGRIYFTSRPGGKDPTKGNVNAVYRVDPSGKLVQLLAWPDVHMPNGIVISPDEKTLYLIEAHPDADHHRNIRAFDLLPNGKLANQRALIDFYPGRSGDGMCIDERGNLYVAAGLHKTRDTSETLDTRPGIHVISPAGKLLAFRETPEDTITNCTFGGKNRKTLYVTCGTKLLAIPATIAGK